MPALNVYMNDYLVGVFTKTSTGAHLFQYDPAWLALSGSRPISLSMPLRHQAYKGAEVYNFFDNLLPDNPEVRRRIVTRHVAESGQPFDLLATIGRDSIGALQFLPQDEPLHRATKKLEYHVLSEPELEKILNGYKENAPLGMIEDHDDFRISIAGAQEKTALLNIQQRWCLPLHATPTTHIIKLPIGEIKTHAHTIDLSQSVENEYLCTLIAQEFGLPVPRCCMMQVGKTKALAVERFDRKYTLDRNWIWRLPQEDFCQALGFASEKKYEKDGGPSIAEIMSCLLGSAFPEQDRHTFMKAQVLFWLLAATDGHAKNFSIFIGPEGRYQLTPLYDIISLYPSFTHNALHPKQAKLAMSLTSSQGKKNKIEQIFPRHFLQTAKAVGFSQKTMQTILTEYKDTFETVVTHVQARLPNNFPEHISQPILDGLKNKAQRLRVS